MLICNRRGLYRFIHITVTYKKEKSKLGQQGLNLNLEFEFGLMDGI